MIFDALCRYSSKPRADRIVSLSRLCVGAAVSRQSLWQYKRTQKQEMMRSENIIEEVKNIREVHHKQGARELYRTIKASDNHSLLDKCGRDKFEEMLLNKGFRVVIRRNFIKTTQSGPGRFPNRIAGMEIRDINKVWMSDITYYQLVSQQNLLCTFYLTSIIDAYSRLCLGVAGSQTLVTEDTTLPAMQMALKYRQNMPQNELIFHSDGGGQYYDNKFLNLLKKHNITSSMAKTVYENPFIERFNGIMKNDYLYPEHINSFNQLKKNALNFMNVYNTQRRHSSLGHITPVEFESRLDDTPILQRKPLHIKKIEL